MAKTKATTRRTRNTQGFQAKKTARVPSLQRHPEVAQQKGRNNKVKPKNKYSQQDQRAQTYGNAQAMGSAQASHQEVEHSSGNTVREDFSHGTTATQSVVSSNEQATNQTLSGAGTEVDKLKKKAPKVYTDFISAVEDFKRADTQAASEMARVDINGILNTAPQNLEPSVRRLREKLKGLFEKTNEKWKAKNAAKDLVLPDAEKLRKLARESGIRDPKALKAYLERQFYYSANSEALANQAGGRDIAEVLMQKGALGSVLKA